ncbi:anthranilate synthase component I [Archaeoglobus veneficus]|uniref:Anthranilate synthase component 1 n=1 Tax=Archaeoglobus veneficus (strain DSM 11195 / SNP6) TaxID=693661 RepID=F2KS86_ARCVS|nr:anthranilate synthase component I [Archaeoglobus veneficus]AEA48025.1 anthranilate synthase component I [Archaeoglobus veneficus SNP6]
MSVLIKKLSYVDPLKLYNVLRDEAMPFILESLTKHEHRARFTFISSSPKYVVEVCEDTRVDGKKVSKERNPFQALKPFFDGETGGTKFSGGFVGYTAYDSIHTLIGGEIEEPSVYGYYSRVFVYDHIAGNFYFLSLNSSREEEKYAERVVGKARRTRIEDEDGGSSIKGCDAEKEEFMEMVERAKEYIFAGDAFQIVLSREYCIETDYSAFQIYRKLREINPSPYMFLLEFDKVGKAVVGASPETMASVENNIVKINPIAGTAPRGSSDEEDAEIAAKLLADEKERAEHVMLVDLARNDVRRVSKPGSVRVTRFFDVVKYSHVQHIESEVEGELADDMTMFDAMDAAFPAGTLTGAPKIRAMEIIDELEKSRRRVYGGSVGYFSINGCADMAIAIRMVEIDKVCRVRAGAGIVADSKPEKEFYETEKKMAAVMKAFGVVR